MSEFLDAAPECSHSVVDGRAKEEIAVTIPLLVLASQGVKMFQLTCQLITRTIRLEPSLRPETDAIAS
nr:hypothetical protein CFP56_52882 [Quercus suber]